MTASLFPLPDDPQGWRVFRELIDDWPGSWRNRGAWLSAFEYALKLWYPHSNSASRKLTARHYAPFFLAAGHDVP